VPDKYFKKDDPVLGVIKYLREQGKTIEFLGFNTQDAAVVLMDGIKYYGSVSGDVDPNYYATFFVVEDVEHDYKENCLKTRVIKILDSLGDMR
jgi:hypothetical protein